MPEVLMVSQPTVAGVAQCVLDWSVGLRDRGWGVSVAAPIEGDLLGWCDDAGIPTTAWESVRSPQSHLMSETRSLLEVIRAIAPDVVVLHSSKAGLAGRLVLRGKVPTLFVPHAWSFDAATGPAAEAALAWERLAARRWTDAIICVSAAEYRRGVASGIKASYHIARNGVDVAAIRDAMAGQDREQVRADLDVAPETRLAVCVGRLATQKGQDVLLRAWESVPAGAERRLVLVGDGPDEQGLRAAAAGDPTITFTGGVDRRTALRWLVAADVVVVPSRWEGMALVPLESLAAGSPVVASDVTGVSEAVVPAVGTLVAPVDPPALAAALTSWLHKPADEMADIRIRATTIAERDFSMTATIAAVQLAITSCLGSAGSM